MGRRRVGALACAWVLLAATGGAAAQDTDGTRAFVEDVVAAINSKSVEGRKALLHPATLTCPRPELFDDAFARQAARPVPAGYRWTMTPIAPDRPLLFADKFDYAIRPSDQLQIDYATSPTHSITLVLYVARDGHRWRQVLGCPTAETVAQARATKAAGAKRAERVRALVAATSPELREAVLKLYRQGRRLDAYKHYERASGEDLATAKDVVELLAAP